MALEIAHREQDGVSILELVGRLAFGREDTLLNDEIRQAIATGKVRLVIDLGAVSKIDSAGWGALLYARAELSKRGGGLALANVNPAQMKMLRVGRMDTVFEIFPTEHDAVESFFAAPNFTRDDYSALTAWAADALPYPQIRRAS